MSDMVNHPAHYNAGKIEVIEFIEDQKLDYHSGSVVKYVCRAGKKDASKEIEDLKKAAWYIARRIELVTSQKNNCEPKRPNDMNPAKTITFAESLTRMEGNISTKPKEFLESVEQMS